MSSSGLHIQVHICIHTPQMYTSVYACIHHRWRDIHTCRETDRHKPVSQRHTQKEIVYFPQDSHKFCEQCLNILYCFILMNVSYSLCCVLYTDLCLPWSFLELGSVVKQWNEELWLWPFLLGL